MRYVQLKHSRKSRLSLSVLFCDDSAVSVGSAIGHTLLPNKKWIDIKIVNELRVKLHVMILKENFCANFHLIKHHFCSTHLV